MLHILIFPKDFEFYLFIIRFAKFFIGFKTYENNENIFIFLLDEKKIIILLKYNDSDIGFLFKLFNTIMFLKNKDNDLIFSMIGSCGGNINLIHNNFYQVSEAIKFDRGELIEENKKLIFVRRLDKEKIIKVKSKIDTNYERITTYSSNMLYSADPKLINSKDNTYCFDMETYDFISTCYETNIKIGVILRICSDFCGQENKEKRLQTRFTNLDNKFLNYIHMNKEKLSDEFSLEKNIQNVVYIFQKSITYLNGKTDNNKIYFNNEERVVEEQNFINYIIKKNGIVNYSGYDDFIKLLVKNENEKNRELENYYNLGNQEEEQSYDPVDYPEHEIERGFEEEEEKIIKEYKNKKIKMLTT